MSCRAALVGFALTLAGCESCPPDQHVIRAMRVLGVTFDPPVAAPGGAVTVRAVAADVESRDVTVAWYRCPSNLSLAETSPPGPGPELDPNAAVTAQVAACIARGEFARGTNVRVAVDAEGGALDAVPYRTARRWTDLVGFACAGGSIDPPPATGQWPRCSGTRGVVFTASIPGPTATGSTKAPAAATLSDFSIGQGGASRAWGDGDVPEVEPCDGTRTECTPWELRFAVADASRVQEMIGFGLPDATDDTVAFVGYAVTGMAPASADFCGLMGDDTVVQPDATTRPGEARAVLRWVPPAASGEVTFWFSARRYSGGLSVVRRTVRVR